METKEKIPKSQRYLNYAKCAGAVITAVIAVAAFVITNWFPNDLTARTSHKASMKSTVQLSMDIQRLYDVQKLSNERVGGLKEQLQLMLSTLHAHMAAHAATPTPRQLRQMQRRPRSASGAKPLPAPPDEKPEDLLAETLAKAKASKVEGKQGKDNALKNLLSKRPPNRALPSLQALQQQQVPENLPAAAPAY